MQGPPGASRILTLVFTDLADSTALKSAKGDQAVRDLIQRHRVHVTRLASECSGRVIDWAGDGCFLTFETSTAAVLFSLRLQQSHADEPDLPGVRIGVHLGEVTESPGPDNTVRIEGLAVDIAARISGLTKPSQVLMSSAVYNSARQRMGVEAMGMPLLWQLHGTYALKGFDAPLDIGEAGLKGIAPLEAPKVGDKARLLRKAKRQPEVYKESSGQGVPLWAFGLVTVLMLGVIMYLFVQVRQQPAASSGEARITSLAVLPLDNLMNDPAQDYFVDGMTEAITAELSKISSLKVISRTSTTRYKETDLSMPEIAEELGVHGLIEGSVLRDGDEVRITVQLIDGPDDRHLWAESYTNTVTSVLKLQAEVALAIAGEIRATVEPDERRRIAEKSDVDPQGLEAYLRGRELFETRTQENLMRALEEFECAIEVDERYASAYSGIADVYILLAAYEFVAPGTAYRQAEEAARKAISIDPSLPEAYASLAFVQSFSKGERKEARRLFEKSLSLDPNFAQGHLWNGTLLQSMGQNSEARRAIERALELDPHSLIIPVVLAANATFDGDLERALLSLEDLLDQAPDYLPALQYYADFLVLAGRNQEALAVSEKFRTLRNNDAFSTSAYVEKLVRLGRLDEARSVMENHPDHDKEAWVEYYVALGDVDGAFAAPSR